MATKKSASRAAAKSKTKQQPTGSTTAVVAVEERLERREKRIDQKLRELKALSTAESAVNKQVSGFVDFLREQSVVGLAIGLVLGTQLKQLVDSIVANFINPFIGLILPGRGTLEEKSFALDMFGKSGTFGWGAVVSTLISFIAVAALVYATFKALKLDRLAKRKEENASNSADDKKNKKK